MVIFVFLDQHAKNLHQRRKRMRLVFAYFIDQIVEDVYCFFAFLLGV